MGASSNNDADADDRLESWKEIAGYLKRDVTTVQRWEKREGMPVHRHLHDKVGSVHALRSELDAWARRRTVTAEPPAEPSPTPGAGSTAEPAAGPVRRLSIWGVVVAICLSAVVTTILWRLDRADAFWKNPIADAKFAHVTESESAEQAAAISRDGRFVAFLSDRDGPVDVWVTQVGTGQFYNLSHNSDWELVNPSLRTLGFSPDGSLVTFWTRKRGGSATDINIWAVPILGGPPRPYVEGAAEIDWSPDGSRIVYHTPGPGDPMFIADAPRGAAPPPIFTAPAGLHSHFPKWSPDQTFIYFVQGSLPDRMDVWRIRPTGGAPERITHHDSRVSHPVFVNAQTLVYLATDETGAGPWVYSVDVNRRTPHRISAGVDRYTSLAASANGERLVGTLATMRTTFWRVAHRDGGANAPEPSRIRLSTGGGSSPRLGPGYMVFVSSQEGGDSLWKQHGDASTSIWSSPGARMIGAPAIGIDGRRIAFAVRENGRPRLYVMNGDGTDRRAIGGSLEWQGTPAWAPDGRALAASAVDGGAPHLYRVDVETGAATALSGEYAVDPIWSPDRRFIVFSGADIGTTFPIKAIAADGSEHTLPSITLSRGARHLRFLPDGHSLVVMKGEIRHKNLWAIDLETGAERQLTDVPADFEISDFDLSSDGREIVLERTQAHSQIVMLDLPRR